MNCPMCGNPIPEEGKLIGPYKVFQPSIRETKESGEIEVCGRCFLLVNILQTLREIKDGQPR